MFKVSRRDIGLLIIVILLISNPLVAAACGGFFSARGDDTLMTNLKIAFEINRAKNEVTEVVGIRYEGKAEEFSWLYPVAALPTLDVTTGDFFDELDVRTKLSFVNAPINYCGNLWTDLNGFGGGGGGYSVTVGPYEALVLGDRDADSIIARLLSQKYRVDETERKLIRTYDSEGNYFVALRLKPNADVRDIQPIVMRYTSGRVTIPVRMGQTSAKDVTIEAWFFSDGQFVPQKYIGLPSSATYPTLSQVRLSNEIAEIGIPRTSPFLIEAKYARQYDAAIGVLQQKHNGHMFLVEYAAFINEKDDSATKIRTPLLKDFYNQSRYLTRYAGRLSPNQMNVDPEFAPGAVSPEFNGQLNIGALLDPLTVYGCATNSNLSPEIISKFANSHRTIPEYRFDIAHPPGWQLSTFAIDSPALADEKDLDLYTRPQVRQLYVYSPNAVTRETFYDYFAGKQTPPMWVYLPTRERGNEAWWNLLVRQSNICTVNGSEETFALIAGVTICQLDEQSRYIRAGINMTPTTYSGESTGVFFALLTSRYDYTRNQTLYDDMIAYTRAHQFFTRPDVRHTLFLSSLATAGDYSYPVVLTVPIPDGWEVHMVPNSRDIRIAPAGQPNDKPGPELRIIPVGTVSDKHSLAPIFTSIAPTDPQLQPLLSSLRTLYGTLDTDDVLTNALTNCPDPFNVQPLRQFEIEGRRGVVFLNNSYVMGVSAALADYVKYQGILQMMIDTVRNNYFCVGAG